jgi:hypothetical protein
MIYLLAMFIGRVRSTLSDITGLRRVAMSQEYRELSL